MTPRRQATLPVEANFNLVVIAQAIEQKVLTFPARLEMFRDDEGPAQIQCDSFLGMCEGCGTPAYTSDAPRILDGEITCPECLTAELSWKRVPVAVRRAA